MSSTPALPSENLMNNLFIGMLVSGGSTLYCGGTTIYYTLDFLVSNVASFIFEYQKRRRDIPDDYTTKKIEECNKHIEEVKSKLLYSLIPVVISATITIGCFLALNRYNGQINAYKLSLNQ